MTHYEGRTNRRVLSAVKRHRRLFHDIAGGGVRHAGVGEKHIGTAERDVDPANYAGTTPYVAVRPFDSEGTIEYIASGAIPQGSEIGPAADGKVQAGVGLGFNLRDDVLADGDTVESERRSAAP
jgi:hypothetical protein